MVTLCHFPAVYCSTHNPSTKLSPAEYLVCFDFKVLQCRSKLLKILSGCQTAWIWWDANLLGVSSRSKMFAHCNLFNVLTNWCNLTGKWANCQDRSVFQRAIWLSGQSCLGEQQVPIFLLFMVFSSFYVNNKCHIIIQYVSTRSCHVFNKYKTRVSCSSRFPPF